MKVYLKDLLARTTLSLGKGPVRRFIYLLLLAAWALADFTWTGLARRTFVFYTIDGGQEVVEERMLKRSDSRELDLTRYVAEALLGPASPDLALPFPRDTVLVSLIYREGVVFVDLSASAALGVPGGGDAFRNLAALNRGIRRNFPFVKEARLFIEGNEVFFNKFRDLFGYIPRNYAKRR
jgi:hypothetical protein